MAYRDLRDFLRILQSHGQLVHYREPLLPEPDISAIGCAAGESESGPALLLDNVIGYKGKRVAINVHGSWTNHALMLGMDKSAPLKDQFKELCTRWKHYPGEVRWIENAPCQENVIHEGINLFNILPLYKINKYDGGFFMAKSCIVSQDSADPGNFDKQNVGTYRIQVIGPDTLALQSALFHDLGRQFHKAEMAHRPFPVAICLGNDPLLTFIASTPIAYNQSEYKYAAALKGAPIEVTKCLTCNLDIPAQAEYVLEGEILRGVRAVEGPFGEFYGRYSGVEQQLLVKIKAVTHRNDPIYENLYIKRGWTEVDTLMALNTSVPLYWQLKESMPEVEAVSAIFQHGSTIIISTEVPDNSFPKAIAVKVASTPLGAAYCRTIILVDRDVDPFNLTEVLLALARLQRDDRYVIAIPTVPGIPLIPTGNQVTTSLMLILDATTTTPPDSSLPSMEVVDKDAKVAMYKQLLSSLRADKEVREEICS